ncbi:MAG: hypothetical protein KC503_28485 [Myxococcales bacterium]|nr:hypothetical protein [Myxococcales bacterium]
MTGARRGIVVALALLFVLPVLRPSEAEARKRIGLAPFRGGRRGRVLRNRLWRVLRRRVRFVSWRRIRRQGIGSRARYRRTSAKLRISAFVTGQVRRRGRYYTGIVVVRNGATGRASVAATWRRRGFRRVLRIPGYVRQKIIQAINATSVAGRAVARDDPPPKKDPSWAVDQQNKKPPDKNLGFKAPVVRRTRKKKPPTVTKRPSGPVGELPVTHAPLELGAGAEFFSRNLRYNDDLFGAMRPYELPLSPAVAAHVDWYPAAHFKRGFISHIGISAAFRYAIGISSDTSTGAAFPTSSFMVRAGLIARIPGPRYLVYLTAGWGMESFSIDDGDGESKPEIPSVSYQFVRLGGGGRIRVWRRLWLLGSLAYLLVVSQGEIASETYFPRAKAGGFEGKIELAYGIWRGLMVRGGFSLRRYFLSMNPEPGDRNVAGGAIDQFINFNVGLVYRFGGSAPSSGGDAEPAEPAGDDDNIFSDSTKRRRKRRRGDAPKKKKAEPRDDPKPPPKKADPLEPDDGDSDKGDKADPDDIF